MIASCKSARRWKPTAEREIVQMNDKHANTDRLEAVLRRSNITAFEQDEHGYYVWISGPFLGFQRDEIIGKQDNDLFAPDVSEKLKSLKDEIAKGGAPINYEFQLDL